MAWFTAGEALLPDIIDLNARWLAAKPAVVCGDETLTWSAYRDRLGRVAAGLEALGLEPGDRVIILMRNGLEMAEALFGTVYGGCVAVPLNVSVSDEGILTLIRDSGAKAVIASHEHVARLAAMAGDLPEELTGRMIGHGASADGFVDYTAWRDHHPPRAAGHPVGADDECNIIYSSGTTGLPKGIVHSHACRAAWAYDMALALRYHGGARTLCSLGLYSNITWVAMLATFWCGGTIVVMPAFDVERFLEIIPEQGITHSAMVPVQFQRILEHPAFGQYDLSSLHSLMCCGSPLHETVKRRIYDEICRDFIELYGLTEGLVTTLQPEDAPARITSVGRPCPGQDIVILGNEDEVLPPGEPGEIVGYGRLLMAGYLNRDDANEEATWTDGDGRRWLRTGDIGRLDEEGFLYLVDRKKDMILSGAQNIYPADIEAVATRHPAVADIAVIGVPSEKWGETPLAVIVRAAGDDTEAEALAGWINERVGKQQRVAGVRFVAELPRNPNGKILKRELRKDYAGGNW
ncbi:MAG: class I adenylate-forming enzyme family protein [Gammaproteobacteria bacterium]